MGVMAFIGIPSLSKLMAVQSLKNAGGENRGVQAASMIDGVTGAVVIDRP